MPVTRTLSTAASNHDHYATEDFPPIVTGLIAAGTQAGLAMQQICRDWQRYAEHFGCLYTLDATRHTASVTSFPLSGTEAFVIDHGADFLFILLDDDEAPTPDAMKKIDRAIQCSTLSIILSLGSSPHSNHMAVSRWVTLGAVHCHVDTHNYFHTESNHRPWETVNRLVSGLLLTAYDSGLICVDFTDLHAVLQGPGSLTFQHWALPANEPIERFVQELSRSALPATLYDNLFVMIEARYTDGTATISHTMDCFAQWGTDQAWMVTGVPTVFLFKEDGEFAVSVYGFRHNRTEKQYPSSSTP